MPCLFDSSTPAIPLLNLCKPLDCPLPCPCTHTLQSLTQPSQHCPEHPTCPASPQDSKFFDMVQPNTPTNNFPLTTDNNTWPETKPDFLRAISSHTSHSPLAPNTLISFPLSPMEHSPQWQIPKTSPTPQTLPPTFNYKTSHHLPILPHHLPSHAVLTCLSLPTMKPPPPSP